jgi:hypothetical protein
MKAQKIKVLRAQDDKKGWKQMGKIGDVITERFVSALQALG